MDTPYDIVRLRSVLSTQDRATAVIAQSGRSTLVVAEDQTAGRGRHGRVWIQPDRALFSSFAFASTWAPSERPVITLCAAVALAETIEDELGVRTDIKWPNDLLLDDKKVAGILVESSGDIVTVGCGANLWWQDPPDFAGALLADRPNDDIAVELATGWVNRLAGHLDHTADQWPRGRYLERSWTIGRSVRWNAGAGTAVDIDDTGGLIVETASGLVTVHSGEVRVSLG